MPKFHLGFFLGQRTHLQLIFLFFDGSRYGRGGGGVGKIFLNLILLCNVVAEEVLVVVLNVVV